MTAKEYMQQAFLLDKRIKLDIEKLTAMRSALYGRGVTYDSNGSHGGNDNGVERAVCKVMEYEEKLNGEIDRLVSTRLEIEDAISHIPDDILRELLTRRYLLFQRWEVIAEKMGYSQRRIFQLHGKALKKIALNFSISL